ncbi:gliding motility-associated C-terminal domain-containing protein [Flavobacterium sp. I3-2]|uniref:gliding motility-associated C-terminal domain-containing protein n=1 Tax=Flavobacterium sp. I3-2 TaxID=2748319 RepID=UPI0015B33E28|nr:gliding motility-associated C-terminal domain-containing protein [Flavobacterium sp. I3-2]
MQTDVLLVGANEFATIGNNNNRFEINETINLIVRATYVTCSSESTSSLEFELSNSCGETDSSCLVGNSIIRDVSYFSVTPTVTMTADQLPYPGIASQNWDTGTYTISNNGTTPLKDVGAVFGFFTNGSQQISAVTGRFQYYDLQYGGQTFQPEANEKSFVLNFANDPDGPDGLTDLDGDGNFNDLPAGKSITFTVKLRQLYGNVADCSNFNPTRRGIRWAYSYKNDCGIRVETLHNAAYGDVSVFSIGYVDTNLSTESGSLSNVFELGDKFNLKYFISSNNNVYIGTLLNNGAQNAFYRIRVVLPLGISPDLTLSPTLSGNNDNRYTLTYNAAISGVNNPDNYHYYDLKPITDGTTNFNLAFHDTNYYLPMVVDVGCTKIEEVEISVRTYLMESETVAFPTSFACASTLVNLSCFTSTVANYGFEINRNTFGVDPVTNLPVNANTPGINLNDIINGDKIVVNNRIKILDDNISEMIIKMQYPRANLLNINDPALHASLTKISGKYINSNNIETTFDIPLADLSGYYTYTHSFNEGGTNFSKYEFDVMNLFLTGGPLENLLEVGGILEFNVDYDTDISVVNNVTTNTHNISSFLLTKLTNETDLSLQDVKNDVIRVVYSFHSFAPQEFRNQIICCPIQLKLHHFFSNDPAFGTDIFPNELRYNYQINNFTVLIPSCLVIPDNQPFYQAVKSNVDLNNSFKIPLQPSQVVIVKGVNELGQVDLNGKYNKYTFINSNNDWQRTDHQEAYQSSYITADVVYLDNSFLSGDWNNDFRMILIDGDITYSLNQNTPKSVQIGNGQVFSSNIRVPIEIEPNFTISSSQPNQQTNTNEVYWDINITNTTFNKYPTLQKFWISIEPESTGLLVPTFWDGANQLPTLNFGTGKYWVQIGDIAQTKSIRIKSNDFNSCDLTNFVVKAGYNCGGYPKSPDAISEFRSAAPYSKSIIVTVSTFVSNLQAVSNVNATGSDYFNICTEINESLTVSNTALGYAYNIVPRIKLPTGLAFVNGSFIINYNGVDIALPDSSITLNTTLGYYEVDIYDVVTPFQNSGLPGTSESNTLLRQFILKYKVITQCTTQGNNNYLSGSRIIYDVASESGCGASALDVIVRSQNINITGAPTNKNYDSSFTFVNAASASGFHVNNEEELVVEITNLTGSVTDNTESIRIQFDGAYDIVSGSVVLDNAVTNSTGVFDLNYANNVSVANNTRTLIWQLPIGFASGQKIKFTFKIKATNTEVLDCVELKTATLGTYVVKDAFCIVNGQNCEILFPTTTLKDINLPSNKPSISGVVIGTDLVINGLNHNFNINYDLTNTSTNFEVKDLLRYDIYKDVNSDGLIDSNDLLIVNNGTISGAIASGSTVSGSVSGTYIAPYAPLLLKFKSNFGISDICEPVVLQSVCCVPGTPSAVFDATQLANLQTGTIECGSVDLNPVLTATGLCGEQLNVTYTDSTIVGDCTTGNIVTRRWVATDLCGNQTIHNQTYTVVDTTGPTFSGTLPAATLTVTCGTIPTAVILAAQDNCGTALVSFTETDTQSSNANVYTITRTWTATDTCGNETVHTQTISVDRSEVPVFSATPVDVTVECSSIPTRPTITASTSCGSATVVYDEVRNNGTCSNSYELVRTWVATTSNGVTATHVQTITVTDTTAPSFVGTLPAATLTVSCGAIPTAVTLTATDNCGTASVSFTETDTQSSNANVYVIIRTWTARDLCGNETVHTQTISVDRSEVPVFSATPADVTVECNSVPTRPTITATSSCGTATVVFDEVRNNGTCSNSYELVRTWVATTSNGVTATHVQTITVTDTTAPSFVGTLPAATLTVNCGAIPTAVTLTATDNCGTATVTYVETDTQSSNASVYTITRTWTARDLCGNETVHTQTISVDRSAVPVFSATPADVTVECNSVPTRPTITATSSCGTATVVFDEVRNNGACSNSYELVRTWVATTSNGVTATHVQTITVTDTTAPSFVGTLPAATLTVNCGAIPTAVTLTATDNCGTATVTYVETDTQSSNASVYTITRTWTARDLCGNETVHTQTISVDRSAVPVFSATPADVTVECNSVPTRPTITATSSCGTATVVFDEVRNNGACSNSYELVRTWVATTSNGVTATHVQTITVTDTTVPSFVGVLPAATLTVNCGAIPTAVTLTATDNCGTALVSFTETDTQSSNASVYTITRTWTARDLCGNETVHTQTISVDRSAVPVFSATPADVTVECNSVPTRPTITATSSCGTATVVFDEVRNNGACSNSYELVRTWVATTSNGVTATHVQTITVTDTTAPSFVGTLPAATLTVNCGAIPTAVTLTATDNCGTATVTYVETDTQSSNASVYTITRTWTARDLCGNETVHTQTISVDRSEVPVFSATPADVTVECNSVPTRPTITATSSCGTATVVFDEVRNNGTCTNSYELVRTWVATTSNGVTATHVQTITVTDTTAPSFVGTLPAATLTVNCGAIPTAVTLTATDNCGTATVTYVETDTQSSNASVYTITRTWTARDLCGNETVHTQTISVDRSAVPVFSATPADVTVECNSVPTRPTITATSSCGTATVVYDEVRNNGTCSNSYELVRTWVATTSNGVTATHVQTITVTDTTAPSFVGTLPAATLTVNCGAIPTAVTLTATDNCGTATVTYVETDTQSSNASVYTITRTWTARDLCGNETVHTQTISVDRSAVPVFSATPADVTVECNSVPTRPTITATSSCGTATVVFDEVRNNGTCSNSYELVRTWVATTSNGVTATHVQTITVTDTTAPSFVGTLPAATLTVSCGAIPTAVTLTATDNCGTASVSFTETDTQSSNANVYVIIRTWTARDLCGNETVHTQTISVDRSEVPVFSATPADVTVECNSVPTRPTITATSSCGTATVVFDEVRNNGTCSNSYELVRTWVATTSNGVTATHVQTITVTDTTAPSFVGTLPAATLTVSCGAIPTAVTLTATDNCGTASVSFTETDTQSSNANVYVIIRTWTARDLCGNETVHTQTISVDRSEVPVFSATPADVTVECNSVPTRPTITATSSCGTATVVFDEVRNNGTCSNSYELVRTWVATTSNGVTATHVQTITVTDTTAPVVLTALASLDRTVECSNPAGLNAALVLVPVATDNCSTRANLTMNLVSDVTTATCANGYIQVRTWNFTDECGNVSADFVQTISVVDTKAPVITTAPNSLNRTLECSDANGLAQALTLIPTATDNCSSFAGLTMTLVSDLTNASCAQGYVRTRTWNFTDECGNISTNYVQVITVQDIQAPVITTVANALNRTLECSDTAGIASALSLVPTANDNCTAAANLTLNLLSDVTTSTCGNTYVQVRTWNFTDECGNISADFEQTLTIIDTTAPVITTVAGDLNRTVQCSDATEIASALALVPTATDSCSASADLTIHLVSDVTTATCTNGYIQVRIWNFEDECGNISTNFVQTITVIDTIAPIFVEALPANITVSCDAIPTIEVLTATDNCGTATVTSSEVRTNGSCSNSYTLTRTWIADDGCNNTTVHTQTITVEDTTAPTFVGTLPSDLTLECQDTIPTMANLTATDNCGTATVTSSEVRTNGSCANSFVIVRTWIATDACGLTTTHTQTITVEDITAPTFVGTLPTDLTLECSDEVPVIAVLAAIDNCGIAVVSSIETRTNGSCPNNYTLVRTWTATDECGLTSTYSQTITVQDTTAPEFIGTLPTDLVLECSDTVPHMETLTASDNCGFATVSATEVVTNGSCANTYTIVRTWTATDECGNDVTHTQNITVQDTTAPEFVEMLPTDITVECDSVPMIAELTATDNCGFAKVVSTEVRTDGNCPSNYTLLRTWTATDECGNTKVHTQTVTVQDTTAPEFVGTLPAKEIFIKCEDLKDAEQLSAIDNCGEVTISTNDQLIPGDCETKYSILRTWTATDSCNNETTFEQIIHMSCQIEIFNAVSPNGDGFNDELVLNGIECYPGNSVEIYNRWGVVVFKTNNYNSNGNTFKGHSDARATINGGSLLPSGTYYYLVKYNYDLGNGEVYPKEQTGFFQLESN